MKKNNKQKNEILKDFKNKMEGTKNPGESLTFTLSILLLFLGIIVIVTLNMIL